MVGGQLITVCLYADDSVGGTRTVTKLPGFKLKNIYKKP